MSYPIPIKFGIQQRINSDHWNNLIECQNDFIIADDIEINLQKSCSSSLLSDPVVKLTYSCRISVFHIASHPEWFVVQVAANTREQKLKYKSQHDNSNIAFYPPSVIDYSGIPLCGEYLMARNLTQAAVQNVTTALKSRLRNHWSFDSRRLMSR